MANSRKKISELPPLDVASLDTTFVLGISGSTTYKISINNLTSSLDTTFASDLVTNALSSSLDGKLSTSSFQSYTASISTGSLVTSINNLNTFTASQSTSSLVNRLNQIESISGSWITENETGSFLTSLNGAISGAGQIADLGFVTGSYAYLTEFNSLTQSFNIISGSVVNITNAVDVAQLNNTTASLNQFTSSYFTDSASFSSRINAATNEQSLSHLVTTTSFNQYTSSISTGSLVTSISNLNTFTASQSTSSLVNRLNAIESISGSWITESETGSFLRSLSGAISSSSQLTSSYDTRYVLSGSITQTTWDNIASKPSGIVSGSSQVLGGSGVVSGSYETTGRGIVSGSSQLTSSYDTRYVISGSVGATPSGTISGSAQITAFGFVSGSYETTGRGIISSSANLLTTSSFNSYTASISTASLVTSISNLNVFTASQSTASLVTSITNLNNATSSYEMVGRAIVSGSSQLTSSFDNRYLTIGGDNVISGSSQLTSSYDSRYSLSGSVLTSFSQSVDSRLDNQEAFSASLTTLTNKSTKILDAFYTSATAWSGSYTGTGGTVKVEANFTMFINTTGTRTFTLYRDGIAVDSGSFYFNQINTHTVMPTLYYIGDSEIGTHTYSVGHNATTDVNDTCNIVVTETFNSLNIEGSANYVQVLGASKTLSASNTNIISGSITTKGNPVQIMITGDANPVSSTGQWCQLSIYRDNSAIGGIVQVESSAQNENIPYCLNVIDTPAAGTYTYSMRMVTNSGGNFQYGEAAGPVLTAVELKTNTNLPSLNNTFTGNNTFNGTSRFETVGGDEGGEIEFGVPQTNTSLSTRVVQDIFQNRLRIFDGNTKGVFIDLSKAPTGVAGEITYKTSGYVNAGTFVQLDNIKATVTTSSYRGLSLASVSGTFSASINGTYTLYTGGVNGMGGSFSITTTPTTSLFGWSFPSQGDAVTYIINDTTNSRAYRITLVIGGSYNNNFISIERLH